MPGDPRIRACDADRDRAAALLREHHAAGRLTTEEFNERLGAALSARTLGDIDGLLRDLPSIDLYLLPDASVQGRRPGRRPAPGQVSRSAAVGWGAWAAVNSVVFAVWLAAAVAAGGSWFPWFLFVTMPSTVVLLRHGRR